MCTIKLMLCRLLKISEANLTTVLMNVRIVAQLALTNTLPSVIVSHYLGNY